MSWWRPCYSAFDKLGVIVSLICLSAERISHLYSSFSSKDRFVAAASAAVAKSSFDTCLGVMAKLRPFSNAQCSMFVSVSIC